MQLRGMREIVFDAMSEAFKEAYERYDENYNPDTIGVAADRVLAAIATELLDTEVRAAHHPTIIGAATFALGTQRER